MEEQILDDFIKIIETFNNNGRDVNRYYRNKLINSLFNNNILKNDSNLVNKLIKKISNFEYEIDSKEMLINI